jgi:3-(3-hydroxy-phenyl)propionate hydroxylase
VLRDAVLSLAAEQPFARALVNSGRLSVPAHLLDSPLNTADEDSFEGWMRPGAPADDAPLAGGRWLLRELPAGFVLLVFGEPPGVPLPVPSFRLPCDGPAAQRYDARPGTCVLLRPDQHVAARWRTLDIAKLRAALARAMAIH